MNNTSLRITNVESSAVQRLLPLCLPRWPPTAEEKCRRPPVATVCRRRLLPGPLNNSHHLVMATATLRGCHLGPLPPRAA